MTDDTGATPFNFKREMLATLPNLRAFAVSLTNNRHSADDLVQDTIMKAWARQETFSPGTNMKAWLFTILRNEFYSQMRKRGREIADAEGSLTEQMATHPEQYGSMDMADFRSALDKLPEDQREAIVLVGASGFSYEEAAEISGCAVGTIKSRVSRARSALQDLLAFDNYTEFGPDRDSVKVTTKAFVR